MNEKYNMPDQVETPVSKSLSSNQVVAVVRGAIADYNRLNPEAAIPEQACSELAERVQERIDDEMEAENVPEDEKPVWTLNWHFELSMLTLVGVLVLFCIFVGVARAIVSK